MSPSTKIPDVLPTSKIMSHVPVKWHCLLRKTHPDERGKIMQEAFRAKISERPFSGKDSSLHQLPELLNVEVQEFFHASLRVSLFLVLDDNVDLSLLFDQVDDSTAPRSGCAVGNLKLQFCRIQVIQMGSTAKNQNQGWEPYTIPCRTAGRRSTASLPRIPLQNFSFDQSQTAIFPLCGSFWQKKYNFFLKPITLRCLRGYKEQRVAGLPLQARAEIHRTLKHGRKG